MAKTRAEEWLVKGLKWGAIAGAALFVAVSATVVTTAAFASFGIAPILGAIAVYGVIGAVAGAASGALLGGLTGLLFKKDNGTGEQQPASMPQQMAMRSPQPSMQPQLVQAQSQGPASTYFQDQVAASRTPVTIQR